MMPSYTLRAEPGSYKLTGIEEDANFKLWKAAVQPGSAVEKGDPRVTFFFHLGFAINRWAFVERELFHIFRFLLGSASEGAAAYLFYKQPTLTLRFGMVDTLVEALLDGSDHAKRWKPIRKRLEKEVPLRNRLAHDPSNQIVSAGTAVEGPESVIKLAAPSEIPPPVWELRVEASKLLQPKKPSDLKPVTVQDVIAHIGEVTSLQSDLADFRERLPKRLSRRRKPPVAPKGTQGRKKR